MLPALAFVSVENVVQAFEILVDNGNLPAELDPLVDYFEDTWIGRQRGNGRRNPLFQIAVWNCFDATRNGKLGYNIFIE